MIRGYYNNILNFVNYLAGPEIQAQSITRNCRKYYGFPRSIRDVEVWLRNDLLKILQVEGRKSGIDFPVVQHFILLK